MKIPTKKYKNTFITIADDCPASIGEIPPIMVDSKTVANIQFEIITKNPYKFTSDDVLFQVFAERNDLLPNEYEKASAQFFLKGQPCFSAYSLTKRYVWGMHCNNKGKVVIFGAESEAYKYFLEDNSLKIVKAMKSSK